MAKKTNKQFIQFITKAVKAYSKTEDGKLAMKMDSTMQITGLLKWLFMEGRVK